MLSRPLALSTALTGLADTHQLLMAEIAKISDDRRTLTVTLKELRQKGVVLGELLASHPADPDGWSRLWRQLTRLRRYAAGFGARLCRRTRRYGRQRSAGMGYVAAR